MLSRRVQEVEITMDFIWLHLMRLKKYKQKRDGEPSPFLKRKSLFDIKPIEHHDLIPRVDKIIYEFFFAIYRSIDFCN